MTRILLVLLCFTLLACSHNHPLTDHQHDHEHPLIAHEHSLINHTHEPVAYPDAKIIWEDPGQSVSDKQPIGIGKLTYEGLQQVWVLFSEPPIGLTVTDVPDPDGRSTIPISGWRLEERTLKISTYCTEKRRQPAAVALRYDCNGIPAARCCAMHAQIRRSGSFIEPSVHRPALSRNFKTQALLRELPIPLSYKK